MGKLARTFALAAGLSVALVACEGGDGEGVATLGDGDQAAGASATPSMTEEEALQAFGECMRENGVEDFQDPQVNEDGGVFFGGPADAGDGEVQRPSEAELEELEEALEACESLLPRGTEGGRGMPSEEEQAALEDAFLEFAQCMRDHGIDFPDPEFNGDGAVTIRGGGDPDDPEVQAADEACRPLLEDALPSAGGEVSSDAG